MNEETTLESVQDAFRLYEKPLIYFAKQYVHSLQIAQEVVQDTFIKLCQIDLEKVNGKLKPWLFTVCRNRSLEVLRKEKRITSLDEAHLEKQPAKGESPATAIQNGETLEMAMSLLKTLTENEQELIRLKYQHELSYKEMSEVTGLTVSNVGFTLHAALKKLRVKMNNLEVRK